MRLLRVGAMVTVTVSLLAACGSGSGGGSGNQAAFCNTIKTANADKSLNSATPSKATTAKIQKIYDDLAANAPSSISADVVLLRDAFKKFGGDFSTLSQDKAEAKKVQTASTNLAKFSKDKCKLPIGSG